MSTTGVQRGVDPVHLAVAAGRRRLALQRDWRFQWIMSRGLAVQPPAGQAAPRCPRQLGCLPRRRQAAGDRARVSLGTRQWTGDTVQRNDLAVRLP